MGDLTERLPGCCDVQPDPLGQEEAAAQAAVFKALADPVRLRLLALIAASTDDGACVCDLVDGFELSQPTISHHLKVLRNAGLVESERRGTWVYYRIRPQVLADARRLMDLLGADQKAAAPELKAPALLPG